MEVWLIAPVLLMVHGEGAQAESHVVPLQGDLFEEPRQRMAGPELGLDEVHHLFHGLVLEALDPRELPGDNRPK